MKVTTKNHFTKNILICTQKWDVSFLEHYFWPLKSEYTFLKNTHGAVLTNGDESWLSVLCGN